MLVEQFNNFDIASVNCDSIYCDVQRCPIRFVLCIDIGASINKQFSLVSMVTAHSEVQWCLSFHISAVHIGAFIDQ